MPNAHFFMAAFTFVLLVLTLILYGVVRTAREGFYVGARVV